MTDMPEQTFGSVKSSFQSPLLAFENPRVDAATSANDFDIRDVRKKKMTIYLGITPDKLAEAAVIVNLFFDQLLSQNTKVLPKQDPEHLKYQCLMILDEFTAIGKVNMIAKSISYQAGYNMRVLTIIQNKSQLEDVYGKSGAVTLMSNHALMIMYAPSPVVQSDAKEYSEMLGDTTVKSTSKSRSYSKQSSHSDSISDQKRALMLPQEIKEIGRWREIVSLENCKPIFCDKIKYFEDPDFTDKINWPLDGKRPIPVIDVNMFIAELQKRLRPATAADKPEDIAGINNIKPLSQDSSSGLFNPDGTLTNEGIKQRAIEIATKTLRDQNGNLISKEAAVKALSIDMGRMNQDRMNRMVSELNSSGNEDEAVNASETSEIDDSMNSMFDDAFLSDSPDSSPKPEEHTAAENAESQEDDEYMTEMFDSLSLSPDAPEVASAEDSDDLSNDDLTDLSRDKNDTESEESNG